MKITYTIAVILIAHLSFGQISNSNDIKKEFTNIELALKDPDKVFRLNLSNQTLKLDGISWSKFINLEYLSLKNDHLKELPKEIILLSKLKILELSGNDFSVLPEDFWKLRSLEELFLNDEKNLNLEANIKIMSKMPSLRILHLENDNLNSVPNTIGSLKNLEFLYLNNNQFNEIPKEIKQLEHLQFLDMRDNKIIVPNRSEENLNFGFRIKL